MALEHTLDSALAKAVRAAGSQTAFGKLIDRAQSTVNDWLRTDTPLPAELVKQVSQSLGIPRHELRPDLFDPREEPPAHPPAQTGTSPSNNAGGTSSAASSFEGVRP